MTMKRLLMICVSLCVSVLVASAMSAAPADFSGTWEMDKSKSEMAGGGQQGAPDSITWKVTQAKDTITIESKTVMGGQERPAQTLTYKLDGSETTGEIPGRGGQMQKVALKAKWQGDGKILELSRVRNMSAQGQDFTVTTTEHLELAEGGKVLKAHSSTETPQGKREQKLTFNKK
jgi:hypothetical protein